MVKARKKEGKKDRDGWRKGEGRRRKSADPAR